jgi:predicted unusual protein kinase regulating ubiquinone biosynthesis (AarF/ABC1/UbiB family)
MCSGLDPKFNLWGQLAPYATKLVSQEVGSNWRVWLDELGNVLKELIAIPSKLGRVLSQVERGDLTVQIPTISRQMNHLERSVNRLTASVVFASFLIGGIMLFNTGKDIPAYIVFGCAGLLLIWMLFFVRGGPRRFHP